MRPETPVPSIVPLGSGGVQIEWHAEEIDLEIETVSSIRIAVYFRDESTNEEWEGAVGDCWELIQSVIDRMTERRSSRMATGASR